MKSFLKENFVLIVGISLPLLLMVFFFLAGQSAKTMVPDPEYDVLFMTNYNDRIEDYPWAVEVKNNQLEISYTAPPEDNKRHYSEPQIFVLDHETFYARKLNIDYKSIKAGDADNTALDDLNKHTLIEGDESPDGYRLERYSNYNRGLVGEVFGFGRYRNSHVLAKEPRSIFIKGDNRFYNAQLLAWIDKRAP